MTESRELREPGRFTVGALGAPGSRVFYFQAFGDGVEVSLKCEKQQAQTLAEHLRRLIADLPTEVHDVAPAEALPPADLSWVVGSISIGLDRDAQLVLVLFEQLIDPDDPEAGEPAQLRLHLRPAQVEAFAAQVDLLVAGSRPICRLCEHPIDPSGHACPRLN
ncbi:MAG: DUF3090 family protein [Acidimicrobiales bacterium]